LADITLMKKSGHDEGFSRVAMYNLKAILVKKSRAR
jgi:hypothetical protein